MPGHPWRLPPEGGIRDLLALELAPVDVAVVDSGVDALHPALAGRVASAARVEPGRGGHCIVPVAVPTDQDRQSHGTPVAGLVAQVAPNARLHDIRIFDAEDRACGASNLAGFRHAIALRCPVISLTAVGCARDAPELRALCEEAYRQGLVVVAARRNVPKPDLGFPAEFSSCVSVCSGHFRSVYEYRYTGRPPIEFAAWGEGVPAPAARGGMAPVEGTSFAAAVMAGLCALLLGAHPGLAPFEVKTLLKACALQGGPARTT